MHCYHLALLNWQLLWLWWWCKWVPLRLQLSLWYFCMRERAMLIIVFCFTSLSDDGSQYVCFIGFYWCVVQISSAQGKLKQCFLYGQLIPWFMYVSWCCGYGVLVVTIPGRSSQTNKSKLLELVSSFSASYRENLMDQRYHKSWFWLTRSGSLKFQKASIPVSAAKQLLQCCSLILPEE